MAATYVAYRSLMWPILLSMGFPVSTVPFYLVFVGLAVDMAFRIGREHRALTAGTGVLLGTAFGYGMLWVQSQFRPWILGDAHTESAPPVAYWTIPITLVGVALIWWAAGPVTSALSERAAKRRKARETRSTWWSKAADVQ